MERRAALVTEAGLVAGVLAVALTVVQLPLFALHPEVLSFAIAADLVVFLAVVHLVFGVRFGGLPTWTVSIVALGGGVATSLIVPNAEGLLYVGALLAGTELLAGGVALTRWRRLRQGYREALKQGKSGREAWTDGLELALESRALARAVVLEVSLLWFGVVGVFRKGPSEGITHHREVGWMGLAGSLVFLSSVEVPMVHFALDHFVSAWLAWAVTVLSVYGVVWIWGDAQALRLEPSQIEGDVLDLRVGLRWAAQIPLEWIVDVVADDQGDGLDVSIGGPNLRIELDRPVRVHGLFGIEREVSTLSLRVDRVEQVRDALLAHRR